jgi:hypothetical protein
MEGVLSCNASSIHDILICCLNTKTYWYLN